MYGEQLSTKGQGAGGTCGRPRRAHSSSSHGVGLVHVGLEGGKDVGGGMQAARVGTQSGHTMTMDACVC